LAVYLLAEMRADLAAGGHWKANSPPHTRHLLDHAGHVDLVICAGAAGALVEGIAVGDVVVGLRTIEHDFQSRFSGRPAPIFDGDAGAIQSLRGLVPSEAGFAPPFGGLAGRDANTVSGQRSPALRR